MKVIITTIILVIFSLLFSCQNNKDNGKYCADVEYYNPNTKTKSTYTLNVEVKNNKLTKIYWANGGWLDTDHFNSEELDENGWCSFTNDTGNQYEVQINDGSCNF